MKPIYFILFIAILFSCSQDSSNESFSANSGQGGSLARFIIVNDFLYTVDNDSLNVFDLANPNQPNKVNDIYIGFGIETIYSFENVLFIGSQVGMYMYDLSMPAQPTLLSEVNHLRACDPVVSNFTHTFVTLHTTATCIGEINQLEVYDTGDLTNPILLTTVQFERPIGMGLYDDYLILSDKDVLRFLDITNPQFPNEIHTIPIDSFDVIVRGDELYVIGENKLSQYQLDSGNISQTTLLSEINI